MKAVICSRVGEAAEIALRQVAPPRAGPGQVRLGVRAIGVNLPDILMTQGRYQFKPAPPFSPGFEAAGEIVEVGAGVTGWRPGDRAIGHVRFGAYAEQLVVPESALLALPPGFDFAAGAAFIVAYATAYVALVRRGRVRPGETLVVLGAGGGVGLAAVELGAHLGGRVIAVVGGPRKAAAALAKGAARAIDHHRVDPVGQIRDLTRGRGAEAVFDPVGGGAFHQAMAMLAPAGRLLVVGFAGGRIATVAADRLRAGEIELIGVRAGEYARRDPARGRENGRRLLELAESGALRPAIHAVLPLDQWRRAWRLLRSRDIVGKVVLEP